MHEPHALRQRAAILMCVAMLSAGANDARAEQKAHPPKDTRDAATMRNGFDACRWWLSATQRCLELPAMDGGDLSDSYSLQTSYEDANYDGIKRDTYYFLGLQFAVIGVLYVMPENMSGWSEEQKEQHRFNKWWNNVSHPKWDEDKHWINYVLHPYWGAAYHVRARERGYNRRQAFWYSFLLSTMYEFGVEALFEPPSIQDFFVTPLVGSWLGGHFVQWRAGTREHMRRTGETRFRDRALLVATDPLGNVNRFIDRRLGRDAQLRASPFVSSRPPLLEIRGPARSYADNESDTVIGLTLTLRW